MSWKEVSVYNDELNLIIHLLEKLVLNNGNRKFPLNMLCIGRAGVTHTRRHLNCPAVVAIHWCEYTDISHGSFNMNAF
jgi:transposase